MRPAAWVHCTSPCRDCAAERWGPTPGYPRAPARQDVQGFTLVELLVSIVILGILVAIAVNITSAKDSTYLAVMQSDLRNLVSVQEGYFANYGTYAKGGDVPFNPSPDVNLVDVASNKGGWSARVQHEKRTDFRCAIFIGAATPIFAPAVEEGVINCVPNKGGGKGKGK